MNTFYGIIPARYDSTRFPGKPLAAIGKKPMIQWVYENSAKASMLNTVCVATDDNRIENTVQEFGGRVLMTSIAHPSGTDRVFEAAEKIIPTGTDLASCVIINIQGDEPFINPDIIDQLCRMFERKEVQIATLVRDFDNDRDISSATTIKVALNKNNEALYFSRSQIPFIRSNELRDKHTLFPFKQHIGIYAYRYSVLEKITTLEPSSLEKAESLEQLRWLENGYKIHVTHTKYTGHSVDLPEDIDDLKILFPQHF